ncbi:peroxiredoxin-like family protein [Microscilla marina]|uniref:thioredoxin-dependent peroxiredoxin n=1 Tax=Microscilla marina ATCC 23134 TaxID=313606 RepID=A1ZQK9_MICM2|nr:peroxiredoxin-like family protein [Microscilla marina]EAY27381.1 conserved protein of unknown function; putative AhpC-TSA family [Microscilla marina ATCC 23134]
MNFQEKLQSLVERIEGNMSAESLKIMHKATQELVASGIQEGVLKTNDQIPLFALHDQNGSIQSSEELLKQGPLILTFYRGFWCPYCNADLVNLNKHVQEIEYLGAKLFAVSPELPVYSQKIISTQRLKYGILYDSNNQLAAQIGLKWFMKEPLKSLYRDQFNINLNQYHGDQEWALPMPARVLVGKGGIIKYIESDPDYRKRPNVDALIKVLKTL